MDKRPPWWKWSLYLHMQISMNRGIIKRVGPECLGFTGRLLSRVINEVYDDAIARSDER